MGWWKAMLGAGCVTPLAGCNLYQLAAHNLINEPVQYADECSLDIRLREEARLAWREVCRQYPERTFTLEFADGFQDGYADHLRLGGPPRPPAVPPLKYRRSKYFTPEGSLRVRDYLCGAKYGAEVAAATGYRTFLTVPAMVAEPKQDQPLHVTLLPAPPDPSKQPPAGEPEAPPPAAGPLPTPKPLADDKPTPKPPADDKPAPAPATEPLKPDPLPLGTPKPADPPPAPKVEVPPLGTPKTDAPPTPKFDPPPKTAPAPRPSPLKPGETGTGLPAIDLPFPDFLAPPPGLKAPPPAVTPQGGTDADPSRVVPAAVPTPPAVTLPAIPAVEVPPPPAGGPPKPRPAASEPPKPRPAASEPPGPK